jgi:hypothetical protein
VPAAMDEVNVLDRLYGAAQFTALPGEPSPALLLVVEARRQPLTAAARALLGADAGSSPFLYDALVTDGDSKAVVVLHPDLSVLVETAVLRAGAQIEVGERSTRRCLESLWPRRAPVVSGVTRVAPRVAAHCLDLHPAGSQGAPGAGPDRDEAAHSRRCYAAPAAVLRRVPRGPARPAEGAGEAGTWQ